MESDVFAVVQELATGHLSASPLGTCREGSREQHAKQWWTGRGDANVLRFRVGERGGLCATDGRHGGRNPMVNVWRRKKMTIEDGRGKKT